MKQLLAILAGALIAGSGFSAAAAGSDGVLAFAAQKESGAAAKRAAFMGINMEDLTKTSIRRYDYPQETGALITVIVEGSAAEKAGLAVGDIIYKLDGEEVANSVSVQRFVAKHSPGDKVAVVVYRKGQQKKITIVLGERPVEPKLVSPGVEWRSGAPGEYAFGFDGVMKGFILSRGVLGMALYDLEGDLAEYFKVKEGILVLEVAGESPAGDAGVRAGDAIVALNGVDVESTDDLLKELTKLEEGETAELGVVRKGAQTTISIEVSGTGYGNLDSYLRPFDRLGRSEEALKMLEEGMKESSSAASSDARKLKTEIKTLQERLQQLERRLKDMEKDR